MVLTSLWEATQFVADLYEFAKSIGSSIGYFLESMPTWLVGFVTTYLVISIGYLIVGRG